MTGTGFVKGLAVGVLTGAAIGVMITPKSKDMKRKTGRFLRTAGEVIDNICGIWG